MIKILFYTSFLLIFIYNLLISNIELLAEHQDKNRIIQSSYLMLKFVASQADEWWMIFLVDASGGARFFLNFVAYASVLHEPFGFGIGYFREDFYISDYWDSVCRYSKSPIYNIVVEDVWGAVPQTYLANIVGEVGVLSFPIALFIGKHLFNKPNNRQLIPIFFALKIFVVLTIIVFQCQVTNPVPWLLMAFLERYKQTNSRQQVNENTFLLTNKQQTLI